MTYIVSVWERSKNLNFSPSASTLLAQVWDSLAWFVWMQGLHWPLAEAQLAHQLKSSVGEAALSAWLFKALFLSPEPDSREPKTAFFAFISVLCVRLFPFSKCHFNMSHWPGGKTGSLLPAGWIGGFPRVGLEPQMESRGLKLQIQAFSLFEHYV